MLILTRKEGQTIHIGSDIVVKVLGRVGSQVKIGVDAPKGVEVWRGEIYQALSGGAENTRANRE